MLARLGAYVRGLLGRNAVEAEVDEELRFHLEMEIQANVARGMTPTEARRVALRDLGGVTQTKEAVREVRTLRLDLGAQYLRLALRRIHHQPVLAVCVIALVALGVAVNTAVFSAVDGVLLKPLPYPEPDQLVALGSTSSKPRMAAFGPISPRCYLALRDSYALSDVAVMLPWSNANGPDDADVMGADVSPTLFQVLRERPMFGRTLSEADATPAEPRSVLIGYDMWRSRFGGDPGLAGRVVTIAKRRLLIVGVMKRGFDFPNGTNVWAAAVLVPEPGYESYSYLQAVGRLRPGVPVAAVEQALGRASGVRIASMPLRDWIRPNSVLALALLSAGTVMVLLLTWIEVAFLQLTRVVGMGRDIGVRLALGGCTRHIVAQHAIEGAVLAAAGLGCAWLGTRWLLQTLLAFLPVEIVRGQQIAPDARALAFASLAAAAGIVAFVVVPVRLLGTTVPANALRGGAPAGSRPGAARLRTGLLVTQVALSCALVYLGGLTLRSFIEVTRVDLGFRPGNLFAVSLPRYADGASTSDSIEERFAQTTVAVQHLSGVERVTGTLFRPFSRGGVNSRTSLPGVRPGDAVAVTRAFIAPGYFATVGGRLVAGREFDEHDGRGMKLVAVVNETAARLIDPARSVVDRAILVDGLPHVVVGVVGDVRMVRPDEPPKPQIYSSCAQWLPPSWLLVRIPGSDRASIVSIRDTVRRMWKAGSPTVVDLSSEATRVTSPFRMRLQLLMVLAATGLALTTIGLYGGTTYGVRQRSREYAIRMALGAEPSAIRRDILTVGARIAATGVVAGLGLGLATAHWAAALFFNVSPSDLATAVCAAGVACCTTVAALVAPSLRAGRIDPSEALRQE
jgi:predicted permease